MSDPSSSVTRAIADLQRGDESARDRLFSAVYDELRRTAGSLLASERSDHTLQATALVHEAYLRLTAVSNQWSHRHHFLAAAASVMRRILVDAARSRNRHKRGGSWRRVEFEGLLLEYDNRSIDVVALDEALNDLAEDAPRAALVVEQRMFAGYDQKTIGEILAVSDRTVRKDLEFARCFLVNQGVLPVPKSAT